MYKGGTRQKISVNFFGTAYWANKIQPSALFTFSKEHLIDAVQYLLNNCYFKLGDKLFKQQIGIPMGSDPAPFFANLFLYWYESTWLLRMKKENNGLARKFGSVFRFIDDLLAMNDGGSFAQHYLEIYPEELELKKENVGVGNATFLDLNISKSDKIFETKLYDKRDAFGFPITRLPFRSSNIPLKMFYSSIGAEVLRICRSTSKFTDAITSVKTLLQRMVSQGALHNKTKQVVNKVIRKNGECFQKFTLSSGDILKSFDL